MWGHECPTYQIRKHQRVNHKRYFFIFHNTILGRLIGCNLGHWEPSPCLTTSGSLLGTHYTPSKGTSTFVSLLVLIGMQDVGVKACCKEKREAERDADAGT